MTTLRLAHLAIPAISTCLSLIFAAPSQAAISVTDDLGNAITLARPAQRIISLSPHVTELVFAAGAGDQLIGTVEYSDYPAAAKTIPRVGDNRQLDIERIIAMKPDLLVVWMHGAFERQLEPLRKSGIPYYFSEPHKLDDIPATLLKLGQLFGTEKPAQIAADEFRQQLHQLTTRYQNKPTVRTFYQVWGKPIYTLNDKSIVSDAIRVCGGENIFGRLSPLAPVVGLESVIQENPEVILTGDSKTQAISGIEQWKSIGNLLAVKNNNLFVLDGDQLNRAGPRIIDGAKAVCEALDQARSKRGTRP
ncbi:cobalamin-binding protein [Undibacterium sp. Jales W-56]|uniref:cobalamin-binding protein n=1 Tax=Undibacterium sp. Jales W-56 TaxID=2897325 RepID=UPI0021D1A13B|nr:cobalamin-binding protein [Undibacterium sp. Jales W-56]MCU6433024.1 cobalamin-binding protein [Undibacterium sp. Jales W-56]